MGELESKPEMKKLLLILLVVAGVGVGGAVERPNVVLILADDMGYADAGFNGGREVRTPHLDGLARGGAVLKSFYVQPVCSPTRAALMTGRWATRTGVYTVVRPHAPWGLKLEEQVMAQMLGSAGYETAVCGKWHLGSSRRAIGRRGADSTINTGRGSGRSIITRTGGGRWWTGIEMTSRVRTRGMRLSC